MRTGPRATATVRGASAAPRPQPAKTDYISLMHYCALWKEGTHWGWKRIEPYPERRPAIGLVADRVLGDIEPQKVKIGAQLAAIRPEMERLAALHHMDITDLFVLYMDRCSEIFALQEADLQEVLRQL